MENRDNYLLFESDDEFADFCVAPYAVVKTTRDGRPFVCSDYSDLYKQCIREGKKFIIMDENSKVFKHNCVSKRVSIKVEGFPSYHRDTLVQLNVENLEDYSYYLFKEKARKRRMHQDV